MRTIKDANYETGYAWRQMSDVTVEVLVEFGIEKFEEGAFDYARQEVRKYVDAIIDNMIDRGTLDFAYPEGDVFDVSKINIDAIANEVMMMVADELMLTELNLMGAADEDEVVAALNDAYPDGNAMAAPDGFTVSTIIRPLDSDYGHQLPDDYELDEELRESVSELGSDIFDEMKTVLKSQGWKDVDDLSYEIDFPVEHGIMDNDAMLTVYLYA